MCFYWKHVTKLTTIACYHSDRCPTAKQLCSFLEMGTRQTVKATLGNKNSVNLFLMLFFVIALEVLSFILHYLTLPTCNTYTIYPEFHNQPFHHIIILSRPACYARILSESWSLKIH